LHFRYRNRRILADAGWKFLRQAAGDHEIWFNPTTGRKVTIEVKGKSRHTANGVLKDAGLPKRF